MTGNIHGLTVSKSAHNGSRKTYNPLDDLHAFSLPLVFASIEVLFPSTESPFHRPDKRDIWSLEKDMLKRAARRWALTLKSQHGADPFDESSMGAFYEELPELLRVNVKKEVDVDDFLYLTMMQWAKLTSLSVARSEIKITMAEKINPYSKFIENEKNERELRKQEEIRVEEYKEMKRKNSHSGDYGLEEKEKEKGKEKGKGKGEKEGEEEEKDEGQSTASFSLTKSPFTGSFLNQLVESAYKPIGESASGMIHNHFTVLCGNLGGASH